MGYEHSVTGCPSEDQLLAFSQRSLSPVDATAISEHVSNCSDCRVVVATLARVSNPGLDHGAEPRRPLARGTPLGRYLILECVGAGGMGVVYSAYDSELDRRVAIKVLREGGSERQRLVSEARAMARLNHPNVAAIYDVETVDERLFVTMEFIVGETARAWAAKAPRSVDEVLEVFLQAGRGLEAAHAAGLVHRDFKPDNLMVRPDGRVSVLDFGLARATGASVPGSSPVPASSSHLTQTGSVLGTLRYMPPEQRAGQSVDARADQYAFCVSLHEVLFGAPPDEAPIRTPKLPPFLARAIEKGLRPEPSERWPDLHALLLELQRARAPVRRAGWAAAGVVAVAVAAVGGWWTTRVEPCSGGSDELERAWSADVADQARSAFSQASQPEAFSRDVLTRLDGYASAWVSAHRAACEATRVHGTQSEELLDRRMLCLSARREALAALGVLLVSGGPSLKGAGSAVAGLPRIDDCADSKSLLEAVAPPRDPALLAKLTTTREAIAKARATHDIGLAKEALSLSDAALTSAEALDYPPALAEALLVRTMVLRSTGHTDDTEATAWRALEVAKAAQNARLEAEAWISLADVVGTIMRRGPEGLRLFSVAQAAVKPLPLSGELEANRLRAFGQARETAGDVSTAVAAYQQSLALFEKLPGTTPAQLVRVYRRLADVHFMGQQFVEAEAAGRKAVALAEQDPSGASFPHRCLVSLANAVRSQGRFDEARPLLQRAITLAATSSNPLDMAVAQLNLGELEIEADRPDVAIVALQESVARTETLPSPNPYVGATLDALGHAQLEAGRIDDAVRTLRRGLAILDAFDMKDDVEILEERFWFARALLLSRAVDEARPVLEHANALLAKSKAAPGLQARLEFAAAQAAWLNGEQERAKVLARSARDGSQGTVRRAAEAWLSTHP